MKWFVRWWLCAVVVLQSAAADGVVTSSGSSSVASRTDDFDGLTQLYKCQVYCESKNLTAGYISKANCYCKDCMTQTAEGIKVLPVVKLNFINTTSSINQSKPTIVVKEKPQLFCRDYNNLIFKWNEMKMALAYIVERKEISADKWIPIVSTSCTMVKIDDLLESTAYKIRMRVLYENYTVSPPIESSVVSTLNPNVELLPIPKIWVKRIKYTHEHCNAFIKWKPSPSLTCGYTIVQIIGSSLEHNEMKEPEKLHYETRIEEIPFGTRISLTGRAVSSIAESNVTELEFFTPTCLEVHHNLTICAPPMPDVLSINESLVYDEKTLVSTGHSIYNVTVNWLAPSLKPDYYIVNVSSPHANSFHKSINVTSNATKAVLEHVLLQHDYKITIQAFSKGGPGEAFVTIRNILFNPPLSYSVNQDSFTYIVLISILTFFILVMIGASVYVFLSHRRARIHREKCRERYFKELDETSTKCPDIIVDELNQSEFRDEYELEGKIFLGVVLGEGAFGVVRRGWLQRTDDEKIEVAIKMLKDDPTIEEIRQIRQEIEIMKSVGHHPHLVSLICCCTQIGPTGPKTPLLIVEFCARGDLQSYLRSAWNKIINVGRSPHSIDEITGVVVNQMYEGAIDLEDYHVEPKDLLSFARQIVLGMEYLSKLRVVHRDLAARNVLVCDDGVTVKVADFGLSRDIYRDNVYYKKGNGKLPIKWMALESLTHRWYTTQSDVWSFGVLLWEIVTLGGNPYPNINTKDFIPKLESGYRMEKPATCSDEVYKIMASCWESIPSERPTFSSLKKILEDLLECETPYIHVDTTCYSKIATCMTGTLESVTLGSEKSVYHQVNSYSTADTYIPPLN